MATGTPWLGHKIECTGPVVNVMAEGGADAGNRLRAWLAATPGTSPDNLHTSVEEGVDLLDRHQVEEVVADLPGGVVCVVFDTLALHMAGGDENSAKDMGLLLSHLRLIAKRTGAAVGLVHHTGWDTSRERGSTANRGALDVMMQLDGGLLTNVKQKFGPRFDPVQITMRPVGDSLVPVVDDFEVPIGSRSEQLDVAIVITVQQSAAGLTRDELVVAVRRNRGEVLQSVRRLVRDGRLVNDRSAGGAGVLHIPP